MIFKREFNRSLKSLIIWSLALGGLILLMLSLFPQMAEQQQDVDKLLEVYPESIKQAFGMDELNLGTLIGFYGIEVYMVTTLLGSIYASILASSILAKEENEKTIEFLLSKPITRSQIVTQKLLAVVVNIFILNGVSIITSLIGFQFAKDSDIPEKTFMLLVIATILLHLTFASISFMFSSMMTKTRNTLSISLGVVLITYFINVIAGISEDLEMLKYITPFKYVDSADIINNNAIEPLYIFLMSAIIVISILVTYVVYRKKDIAV